MHFVPEKGKNLIFHFLKAEIAPHTPRVHPTALECQFVSVVANLIWAKKVRQTRKSKKKKKHQKKKKEKRKKRKKRKKKRKKKKKKERINP